MKRILLLLILVLSLGLGYGQVTTIDFETAGLGYTPSGTSGSGFTDVFNRTNPNIGGNSSYVWAVEDMSLTNPTITLDQIDITGSTDFTFEIDMIAHHYNDWDLGDWLEITYEIDGGATQNLLWIKNNGATYNQLPSLDTDFDGVGDCGAGTLPALTTGTSGCTTASNTFATFNSSTISLSSNTTLDITLKFNGLTATDEGIYLDNIVITESVAASTVIFNNNGGTGTMADQTESSATNLTLNTFTRSGYTFSGWNTLSNGTGTAYADGASYPFTSSETLYAQWTATGNYTVTFDENGGTGTMANQSSATATNLTSNTFTRAGYTFSGWNTIAIGGGTAYADGASYPFTANETLYAQWTANNNNLTFDGNGSTSGSMSDQTIATNATETLTTNTFIRTGYTFAGWNSVANGSGTAYADAASFTIGTSNETIYAQWTANDYDVIFNGNTSTGGAMSNQTIAYNSSANLNSNTYTKTGFSFVDWNTASDGSGTSYADETSYMMGLSNVTLYAQWVVYVAPEIVITEFAGKGQGASFNDEYIEIVNFGLTNINLSGWTLEYYEGSLEETVTLSGILAPNTAYVIAARSSHTAAITPDIVSSFSMNNPGYAVLKEGTVVRDEAGSSANKFSKDINYEFTDCSNDNKPTANWDNLGTTNGTPGVVNCAVASPEINIQGNTTTISSGNIIISTSDDTDFGDVLVSGGTPVSHTFTIQNLGTADLNLTTITSSNTDFVVSAYTNPTTVVDGDSTIFVVTFTPTATGTSSATIEILSNDTDEATYTFDVAGNGTDVPNIILSSANPALGANSIVEGSNNNLIYAFQIDVTNFDADLTGININTSGTYVAGNITNFKAWYSIDAIFSTGSDVELDLFNNSDGSLGTGAHLLTGFSQTIANGSTGYVFITTNLPCPSTDGNTIIVDAITIADLTFTSGVKSGFAFASGTHTIIDDVPVNVTGFATSNCENSGTTISWTNATGCYDNYVIFASLSSLVTTPSGNGAAYTADPAFGVGDAYDDGHVVYKGTGTTENITGLTNGTNYVYTIFTRNGTAWSSGVEVDCTPAIAITDNGCGSGDSVIQVINYVSTSSVDDINVFVSIDHTWRSDLTIFLESPTGTVATLFDGSNSGSENNLEVLFDDEGISITSSSHTIDGIPDETITTDVDLLSIFDGELANGNWSIKICDGASGDIGSFVDWDIEISEACIPAHVFNSMTPTSGPTGVEVLISGTGFTNSTTVLIGGVSANILSQTSTELLLEIPIGAESSLVEIIEGACPVDAGTFTVLGQSNCSSAPANWTGDLLISAIYDDGVGSCHYIEIYNPTSSSIDLSTYTLGSDNNAGSAGATPPATYNGGTYNLSGIVPASGTFLVMGSAGGTCTTCSSVTPDQSFTALGFNGGSAEDRIFLINNGTEIDLWANGDNHDDGFIYTRETTSTGPTITWNSTDWSSSTNEACVGFQLDVDNPPTISVLADISSCELDLSVTAIPGNGGTLTYKWYYNNGVSSSWTEITSSVPSGLTILGENGNNLFMGSDINDINTLSGFQFYCEVTEDGSCQDVSNAASYEFKPDPFFKSAGTGSWGDLSSWLMAPALGGPWSVACQVPNSENSDYISIENGHLINIPDGIGAPDVSADQVIIQVGGQLEIDLLAELEIEDGAVGSDLIVEGILIDNGSGGANGLTSFNSNATWSMVSGATFIKTNTSSATRYRDFYESGISTIPADANWIYRYNGSGNVSIANSADGFPMFYPNLIFESVSGDHDFNSITEVFTGRHEKVTIKGDLTIGDAINNVKVINNNFNNEPILILGDLYIAEGSELSNEAYATVNGNYDVQWREGTGFELQGDALIEGVVDLTHTAPGTASSTDRVTPGEEGIVFSKSGSLQSIIGGTAESLTTNDAIINAGSNVEFTDINLEIEDELKFTTGTIITDASLADMVWVKNSSTSAIQGGQSSGNDKYVEGKLQWTTDGASSYTFPIGEATHKAQGFTIGVTGDAGSNVLGFLSSNIGGYEMAPTETYAYCDVETSTASEQQIGQGNVGQDGVLDQIEFNLASPLKWEITNPSGGTINEYDVVVLANGGQDINPVQAADGVTDMRYLLKNGQAYNGSAAAGNTTGAPTFNTSGFEACPNQYVLTGMTSFSSFTLNGASAANTTLPVELLYFQAENQGKNVLVSWATVTEINNEFFTVERSKNGVDFEFIAEVAGAGNYTGKLDYKHLDKDPLSGISYYRLKQTDFDGSFEYSEIEVVNRFSNSLEVGNIYPNPVSNDLYFSFNSESEKIVSIEIFDVLGKIVYQNRDIILDGKQIVKIDVAHLTSGSYMFKAKTEKNIISKLFIKK